MAGGTNGRATAEDNKVVVIADCVREIGRVACAEKCRTAFVAIEVDISKDWCASDNSKSLLEVERNRGMRAR